MEKNIAVIWGDCSSPEIVKQTIRVLDKVAEKYGHTFHYTDAAMGGEAIDKYGDPLPQHELDKCLAADSVLLGAQGVPRRALPAVHSGDHLGRWTDEVHQGEAAVTLSGASRQLSQRASFLASSRMYFLLG